IALHLEAVRSVVAKQRAPILHHLPPAETADARRPVAALVFLMLRLGQAEVEQPAVGIDLMAAELGELVDGGLRDALADVAGRLCRGGITGSLHGFPERRRGAVGLRECRLRGKADRRDEDTGKDTHDVPGTEYELCCNE